MRRMIRFVDSPPLSNAELNELFFSAWESWEARDFQPVLRRSVGYVSAHDEKRLIGFVNVAGDGGLHAFLLDATVHPDFQRRGVASALLRFLVARGGSERRKRLFGEVSITARPVFERHGFKVLAYQTVETNGQALGNYRMEKLL